MPASRTSASGRQLPLTENCWDAAYVLDTFPIVRRQDEAAYGTFRTHDLIIAYMNALAVGDTDTVVALRGD